MRIAEIFSKNVKRERKLAGLSQRELGSRAGYAHRHIGKIERFAPNCQLQTVWDIAEALEVDPFDLLRS